jgi:uncharacterized protein
MMASKLRRDGPRWALVAADDVAPGVVVARLDGPIVPWEAVPDSERAGAIPQGEGRWLVPSGVSRHLGRADVPSCAVGEGLEVISVRSILRGEELRIGWASLFPHPPAPFLQEREGEGCRNLRIGAVPGKGRGVFAGRALRPGELIERTPVLLLPAPEWSAVAQTRLSDHCFRFGPDPLDAAVALGYGSLYNHSFRPSAYYLKRLDEAVIDFIALRALAAGEEITVNYDGTPDSREPVWFDVRE